MPQCASPCLGAVEQSGAVSPVSVTARCCVEEVWCDVWLGKSKCCKQLKWFFAVMIWMSEYVRFQLFILYNFFFFKIVASKQEVFSPHPLLFFSAIFLSFLSFHFLVGRWWVLWQIYVLKCWCIFSWESKCCGFYSWQVYLLLLILISSIFSVSFSVFMNAVLTLSAGYVALTDFCFFFSPGVLKSRCSKADWLGTNTSGEIKQLLVRASA